MTRRRLIVPAHGRAREYTGGARLQWYELGEEGPPTSTDLTHRELAIVFLASWGLTTKETAEMLYMSTETVKAHWRNIRRLRGDHASRARIVADAIRSGRIP